MKPTALQRYVTVQRSYDRELQRILQALANDVRMYLSRRGRSSDLIKILNQIYKVQSDVITHQIEPTIQRGIIQAALAAHKAASDQQIEAKIATSTIKRLMAQNRKAIVDKKPTQLPIQKNILRVQRMTREIMSHGRGGRPMADGLYDFMTPTTRGGVPYLIKRLARHSMNTAFHEQQIKEAHESWAEAVIWRLSETHPEWDECNSIATEDKWSLGRGVFPAKEVPSKPHFGCLCWLTYKIKHKI